MKPLVCGATLLMAASFFARGSRASSLGAPRSGDLVSLPFARGEMIFTSRTSPAGGVDFCLQLGLTGTPRVLISAQDAPLDALAPLTEFSVSDDGRRCAYFVTQPDRRYEAIRVVDTPTGRVLDDTIRWTHLGDFTWSGAGFYYGGYRKPDSDLTPYGEERVFYHALGTTQDQDRVVYADQAHPRRKYLFLTTYDHRYLILHVLEHSGGQTLVAEWFRREGDVTGGFQPLQGALAPGRFFLCDNQGDHLVFLTQYKSPKGRVIAVDALHPEEKNWKTILPGPVEDAEPLLGRFVAVIHRPAGGTEALMFSPDGTIEGRIPSGPGTTISVQSCSRREKYAFVSIEQDGAKHYFSYDLADNKLVPIR